MTEFNYQPLFETMEDKTTYRKLPISGLTTQTMNGKTFLIIAPEVLTELCEIAFDDVSHLLRTGHLEKLAAILKDPEASANDRFVAIELLKNAVIAAERIFPSCQDTGTALVMGKRGIGTHPFR